MATREFRYKITALADGVVVIGDQRLTFRQGIRTLDVPLAAVRAFGVVDRGGPVLGMLTSELLLRTERGPDDFRLRRLPWNPTHPACKEAVALLGELLPAADKTRLPWAEAAPQLGVSPRTWHDLLMNPLGSLGAALIIAALTAGAVLAAASPARSDADQLGRTITILASVGLGAGLLIAAWRRTRRR